MPKRENKKSKAQAITGKTYGPRDQERRNCWHAATGPQSKHQVERPCDEAFQLDDLERVRKRYLACQIVVEPPSYAGSGNGERPDNS